MARIRTVKPIHWHCDGEGGGDAPTYLYCVVERNAFRGPSKVGVTGNYASRLSQLRTGNWRPLSIAWTILFESRSFALSMESLCLTKFRPDIYTLDDRIKLESEWIDANPDKIFDAVKTVLGRCEFSLSTAR